MPLFRVSADKLESVPRTTFAAENLLERKDIQRLLRADISALGDDLMLIAEEYGEWEDCGRRIDLLCLSKDAQLVVIEIKRSEDGGHMELQAIRYAAMVSSMTLEQAIQAHARSHNLEQEVARHSVLTFLEIESDGEAELTGEVRIVLVSADFSTELTTAVLWLNKHELDITCIRLRPHRLADEILIDVTQIIPLPESIEYEVKMRAQEKEKRKVVGVRQESLRKFWGQLIDKSKSRTQLYANRSPTTRHWLSGGVGRTGFNLTTSLTQDQCMVECYIDTPGGEERNAEAFNELMLQRDDIEAVFGRPLDWQELPDRRACRICTEFAGGWGAPEQEWPAIQDRIITDLIRLETALKPRIHELKV